MGDIWGRTALQNIPSPPNQGVSYRLGNALTPTQIANGWPFGEKVDSTVLNEYMNRLARFADQLDTQGILSWSQTTPYTTGALVMGSDNKVYQCILPDSIPPATTIGSDPTVSGNQHIWQWAFAPPPVIVATPTETIQGSDNVKVVSPFGLLNAFGYTVTDNAMGSGHQRLPGGLIFQWTRRGPFLDSGDVAQGVYSIQFPITFPNRVLWASCAKGMLPQGITNSPQSCNHVWAIRQDQLYNNGCNVQLNIENVRCQHGSFPIVFALGY